MKSRHWVVLVFSCVLNRAIAQLTENDTAKFQLRSSVTGNYQQGNVELLNIKTRIDLLFRYSNKWAFKSQNNHLYQAFYSRKADNDIFSRNWWYYQPQRQYYPFVIAYMAANFRRKIDLRYFAGAGLTVRMVQTARHQLKLSASAVYEQTRFAGLSYNDPHYNGSNHVAVWRATTYLAGADYLLASHIRLYYDAYWQPALDHARNYRVQIDTGIDIPLYKGLAFSMLFSFTRENTVISGVEQVDKLLGFGLTYHFITSYK